MTNRRSPARLSGGEWRAKKLTNPVCPPAARTLSWRSCQRGSWNRNPDSDNILLTYNNCPVPWPLRVCH
jgi:hypothetical protein